MDKIGVAAVDRTELEHAARIAEKTSDEWNKLLANA